MLCSPRYPVNITFQGAAKSAKLPCFVSCLLSLGSLFWLLMSTSQNYTKAIIRPSLSPLILFIVFRPVGLFKFLIPNTCMTSLTITTFFLL